MVNGEIIKINRIKEGLTQAELAQGIISVSYLSKIENNQIKPNREIYELLCQRLGISTEHLLNDKHKRNLIEAYYNWFNLLIEENERTAIINEYNKLKNYEENIVDEEIKILWEIHLIRYYCKLYDINAASDSVIKLNAISRSFNDKQQYYWNKFRGNLQSLMLNYEKACEYYEQAKKLSHVININEREKADLLYSLGVTYSSLWKPTQSIFNIEEALLIYQNNYKLKRCIQCHITLGISYRRINDIEKAIMHYDKAIHLSDKIMENELKALAYMNKGHLFSTIGKSQNAIDLYMNSLELYERNSDKLVSILGLVKEYYKLNKIDNVKYWLEKQSNINEDGKNIVYPYKIEFKVFELFVNKQYHLFEQHVKGKVIPYFTEMNNHTKLLYYIELLSEYYATQRKYTQALKYKREALNVYKKIIVI